MFHLFFHAATIASFFMSSNDSVSVVRITVSLSMLSTFRFAPKFVSISSSVRKIKVTFWLVTWSCLYAILALELLHHYFGGKALAYLKRFQESQKHPFINHNCRVGILNGRQTENVTKSETSA